MNAELQQKKSIQFIIILIGSYFLGYLLYEYALIPYSSVDRLIVHSLLQISHDILNLLQFESFIDVKHSVVGIIGSSGVNVGYACDGLSLFMLYSIFIVVFPGKLWIKAVFVCVGNLLIHFLNSGRIVALSIIHFTQPELLHFHHTYTFTFLMYGVIFSIWMYRVQLYVKSKL